MSTRQKNVSFLFSSIWLDLLPLCVRVCVCVEGYTFSGMSLTVQLNHHCIVIEGITWMTARKRSSMCVCFMCVLAVECVVYICTHTHTHSPIQSVWQRRQLPTMLFLHALFAITVTGRALASLSDFYEHTCRDYWDLWKHCWEMWKCVREWEKRNSKGESSKMLICFGKWWNIS